MSSTSTADDPAIPGRRHGGGLHPLWGSNGKYVRQVNKVLWSRCFGPAGRLESANSERLRGGSGPVENGFDWGMRRLYLWLTP